MIYGYFLSFHYTYNYLANCIMVFVRTLCNIGPKYSIVNTIVTTNINTYACVHIAELIIFYAKSALTSYLLLIHTYLD